MSDFLTSFISGVFSLIQGEWFSLSFFAFLGLFSVLFIFYVLGLNRK